VRLIKPVDHAPPGPDLHVTPSLRTTTFQYEWINGERVQRLTATAEIITAQDVPPQWFNSSIWHLGPVADEIDLGIMEVIPSDSFVGVSPQGWLRSVDADHIVRSHPWPAAPQVLTRADAVVISHHDTPDSYEHGASWSRMGPVVAVTEAAAGATIFVKGQPTRVPTIEVGVLDELGAGDVFAVALFDQLSKGGSVVDAGRFAATAASLSVTRAGPANTPSLEEISSLLLGRG